MLESSRSTTFENPIGYPEILRDLTALMQSERDFIANAANCSALLYHGLPNLNWAGFYLSKGADLVLGPFQGKPACVRIGPGRGVCGTAFLQKKTVVVPDVHKFPGHIACDSASNAEIVVPLMFRGEPIGVLDLDSPMLDRFNETDAAGLEAIVEQLINGSDLPW